MGYENNDCAHYENNDCTWRNNCENIMNRLAIISDINTLSVSYIAK